MKKLTTLLLLLIFTLLHSAEIKSIWPLPKDLRKHDTNGDNLIKGEELSEKLLRFDLNKDGIVTPSEAIFAQSEENFKKERPDYAEPRFDNPYPVKAEAQEFKNTILVSCDGFDRAVMKELLDADALPTFRKLARMFSDTDFVVNVTLTGHQTETKPGHAVMITGLIPEHSLVQSNSRFQPVPKGLTIHERIKAHNPQIKTVFVSSKRENVGAMTAEELGNREKDGIKILGGPYLNAKENIDIFSATDKNPADAKKVFLESLEQVKNDRFFAFLHFRSPDSEGHAFGRESKEYRDSLKKIDTHLAEIFDYLKANNIDGNTRIIITADHGFNPDAKHHHFAPWITMLTNDPTLLTKNTPTLFDIPTTIMAKFGVDLNTLDPKPFGKEITR